MRDGPRSRRPLRLLRPARHRARRRARVRRRRHADRCDERRGPHVAEAQAQADSDVDAADVVQADAAGDAGSDASDAQAIDAGTWCQQQPPHAFRSDFDESTSDAGWTGAYVTDGGALVIDPTVAASPPASLSTTAASLASSASVPAALEQDFTMAPTSALDVALDPAPPR